MSDAEKYPPISDNEVAIVEEFLSRIDNGNINNFETLDGFLTASIVGPELISPSELLDFIVSGNSKNARPIFRDNSEAKLFLDILVHHWNHINEKYFRGDVYTLYLAEDDQGNVKGNDWATGFMTATQLCHDSWAEVFNNDDLAGPLIPIFALKYEHSEDLSMRPYKDPVTEEQREKLITVMIVCVKKLYDFFREGRGYNDSSERMFAQSKDKVGRNDLCPCGSGKKFKKCCALKTFH